MNTNTLSSLERNGQVKDYICKYFSPEPKILKKVRENSLAKGLKPIQVPENVGKMLKVFATLKKPKKILEIGTLGGYSTLWLSGALQEGGKLISLELEEEHAEIAIENINEAGLEDKIEIRVGDALQLLDTLKNEAPFDIVFIDADKAEYPDYLEPAISLCSPGSLILSDNLIPKRHPIENPDPRDNEAVKIYEYNQLLVNHPKLDSHLFTTIVGEKGRIDAMGVSFVV